MPLEQAERLAGPGWASQHLSVVQTIVDGLLQKHQH
jgi:hypothetical protein